MQKRTNPIDRNDGFTCANCGKEVGPHDGGSCRNHCPFCLYSMHVDKNTPGDRLSECQGLMVPIGIENNHKKGLRVIHFCKFCGIKAYNRLAPDDDWELVCQLSRVPQEPR